MKFTPTAEDIRVARLLDQELGPIRFIEAIHEENGMTDTTPEAAQETWDDDERVTGMNHATYPEYPYSLADHVYTWSPKLPDGSMLVIRSQTADGLIKAVQDMGPLAGQLRAAWQAVTGGGAPQTPAAVPVPQGVNYNPQMPPPNQPYPGQETWQQAGAPQAPQWGGGQPQNGPGLPAGWYRLNVPFPQKAAFDAIVSQNNFRKGDPGRGGQVSWRKEQKFWACSPEIAQAFAQFSPVPA